MNVTVFGGSGFLGSHVADIVVQQILSISRMGIMTTGAGEFPVGHDWILDSSHRMSFPIEPGNP